MRIHTAIIALGAALVSGPTFAQVGLGTGANVNANVNAGAAVNPGGLIGGLTGTVDRTVNVADRAVNRTLSSDLRLATRADLRTGAEVRDGGGRRVGTVQSLHGNMAVVVQGNRAFHVPVAALYRGSKGLVTSLTATQLQASASAKANAHAHGGMRH